MERAVTDRALQSNESIKPRPLHTILRIQLAQRILFFGPQPRSARLSQGFITKDGASSDQTLMLVGIRHVLKDSCHILKDLRHILEDLRQQSERFQS